MERVLVAVTDYPSDRNYEAMMFVHIRNKKYEQHGIRVTVLNFACKNGYMYDGIKVISLKEYEATVSNKQYDKLVMHAPNLRNHFLFLMRYEKLYKEIILVFHGHEIMNVNKEYPPVFKYVPLKEKMRRMVQRLYDPVKLFVWKSYLPNIAHKTNLVFVSNFLYNKFICYVGADKYLLGKNVHIIPNGVGDVFEGNCYNVDAPKEYDFITVRSRLDASECCADLLMKLARRYRQYKFLIIGQGDFFHHYAPTRNVKYLNGFMSHKEILAYANLASCAIMLTRHDTQGVMSCELASCGMPLITSDIDVCREVFEGFENVAFFSNEMNEDLSSVYEWIITKSGTVNEKYHYKNTIIKEEELIREKFIRKIS